VVRHYSASRLLADSEKGLVSLDGFVLTLSCPDRLGIVHAVTGLLAEQDCNIVDSQQFGDRDTGRFFMRVHIEGPHARDELRRAFEPIGTSFAMDWHIHAELERQRILIMVSTQGHCLNDLLYRQRVGALPADIAAIVSNHHDFEALASSYEVPFYYLPATAPDRDEQLLSLVGEHDVELVVLARYMQVLSARVCEQLPGRIINIHHSFLPSFKGAKPYHQAHDRGVKLIGATAHYVTANLDEGPIIEQEVARVDHGDDVEELTSIGRDVECLALARAVRWHLEHRVLLDGHKTIVFR
jgi:formyltetrahydrofolate deformylase